MTNAQATSAKPDALSRWAKENFEAIVIAFAFALIIRCFFIEVFKIPSSSMEPTLLGDIGVRPSGDSKHTWGDCYFKDQHRAVSSGDSAGGDRIMVTKYYYGLTDVDRFDVIVFKFPLNISKNYIKRVVGLPDEDFKIQDGDVWFRKHNDPDKRFRLARKPLRIQDSIWIDMNHEVEWACPEGHEVRTDADTCRQCGRELQAQRRDLLRNLEAFESAWKAEEDESERSAVQVQDGLLRTSEKNGKRDIHFKYLKGIEDYDSQGEPIDDVRLSFDFNAAESKGAIAATIVNRYATFDVELKLGETGNFTMTRGKRDPVKVPLSSGTVVAGRWHSFELMVFDGIAHIRLDGKIVGTHDFITFEDDAKERDSQRDRAVRFGCRGVAATFKKVTLSRDIHHKPRGGTENIHEGEPVSIPPDKYIVMGDNTNSSHDSRAWRLVRIELKDGRIVEAEHDAIKYERDLLERFKRSNGKLPELVVTADINGNMVPIFAEEVADKDLEGKSYKFVHADYIVGKALWIWWPPGRWFRLIK